MIDVQAREITEKDLEAGLRLAHPEVSEQFCSYAFVSVSREVLTCLALIFQAVKFLEPQIRLAARAGKNKKDYKLSMVSEKTLEKVRNLAETQIEAVFTDSSYGKVHTNFFVQQTSFREIIFLNPWCFASACLLSV